MDENDIDKNEIDKINKLFREYGNDIDKNEIDKINKLFREYGYGSDDFPTEYVMMLIKRAMSQIPNALKALEDE